MPTSNIARVAKAGVAGACAVYLIVFGIFLLLPGVVMIAMGSDSDFDDDFFDDHNSAQKTVGVVLLVMSIVCIVIGTFLCIYVCKQASGTSSHSQGGVVITSNQPVVSHSGAPPPVGGYHPQAGQPSYQPVQTYPAQYPPQQSYPNQPAYPAGQPYQPYPTQQPYPQQAGAYPQQGYPPPPAGGYPGMDQRPPPTAPGAQPSAPPSYNDATALPPKI